MGGLLQRLATHVGLLWCLFAFLPLPLLQHYSACKIWRCASRAEPEDVEDALHFVLHAVWGDVQWLDECDPVWWHNSLGLALFVVAKDVLQLLHMWLSKRELATQRVRSRKFVGVDPRELDLLPAAQMCAGMTLPGTF
ncbi:hypothetical protein B0H17DRAFT_1129428 [Mycena rosella]|uniref:Uncharacterized protein n=1 Tax=Mycena rosella TaxID=1033263 RepID=A0AAD7GNK5_MYCRO|nr:hypothetical protein B0H17DRAFT_1129428 [Mycena rosella]